MKEKKRKRSGSGENIHSSRTFSWERQSQSQSQSQSHQRGMREEGAQQQKHEHEQEEEEQKPRIVDTTEHILDCIATAQAPHLRPQGDHGETLVGKISSMVCRLMIGLCRHRLDSMTLALASTTSESSSSLSLHSISSSPSPSSPPLRPERKQTRPQSFELKLELAKRYVAGERAIVETCLASWEEFQPTLSDAGAMEDGI
jgi:hypothetical protein